MNKKGIEKKTRDFLGRIDAKGRDVLLLFLLAIILIFTAWQIFHGEDSQNVVKVQPTEAEQRVMQLLGDIDGVGEANVVIYETKEGIQSVVIVCEGARDLQVLMDVRSAVSAVLGTEEKMVKVYLKKE